MSHYISDETRGLLSIPPVYDLTGVICHKGSMGIGHYTCMVQCLSQQGQTDIGKSSIEPFLLLLIFFDILIEGTSLTLCCLSALGCSQFNSNLFPCFIHLPFSPCSSPLPLFIFPLDNIFNASLMLLRVFPTQTEEHLALFSHIESHIFFQGWRHFDDDHVSKIDDDRVIDSSAYVLVYRMRGTAQALKSDSPFPCLQSFANEGKQDKAAATVRLPGRQLSVDGGIKASCRVPSSENLHTKETTWLSGRRSESFEMMQERPPQLSRAKSLSSEDMCDEVFELADDGETNRGSIHDAMDVDLAGSTVELGEQANFMAETTEDEEMIEADPSVAPFDHRSLNIDMQSSSAGLRSYGPLDNPNGTSLNGVNPLTSENTTTLEEELELKPCKRTKSELEDQITNDSFFETTQDSDERYYLACSDMKQLDLSDVDLTENELD